MYTTNRRTSNNRWTYCCNRACFIWNNLINKVVLSILNLNLKIYMLNGTTINKKVLIDIPISFIHKNATILKINNDSFVI